MQTITVTSLSEGIKCFKFCWQASIPVWENIGRDPAGFVQRVHTWFRLKAIFLLMQELVLRLRDCLAAVENPETSSTAEARIKVIRPIVFMLLGTTSRSQKCKTSLSTSHSPQQYFFFPCLCQDCKLFSMWHFQLSLEAL